MAIIQKEYKKRSIDISGPDGNAFVILGYAASLSKQLEFSEEKTELIQSEMKSSDYDNLIQTFDKYFGELVDIVQ